MLYYFRYFDVFTELTTLDPKAIIAFFIGLAAGFLGCFIRFAARRSKDNLPFFRPGDLSSCLVWPAFGALFAVVINTVPVISFIIGTFAPLLYKLLEVMIQKDPGSFIPFFKSKKD